MYNHDDDYNDDIDNDNDDATHNSYIRRISLSTVEKRNRSMLSLSKNSTPFLDDLTDGEPWIFLLMML